MINNTKISRFELETEGHLAYASYKIENEVLHIKYVEAAPELQGKGAAGQLMKDIALFAIENNYKINPICGYASAWLKKHNEYSDLFK